MKKILKMAILFAGFGLGNEVLGQTITSSTALQTLNTTTGVLNAASTNINPFSTVAFPWLPNGANSSPTAQRTFTVTGLPAGASNFVWTVQGDLQISTGGTTNSVTLGNVNLTPRSTVDGLGNVIATPSDLSQSKGRIAFSYTFTPVGTGGPCSGVVSTGSFYFDVIKQFSNTTNSPQNANNTAPIIGPTCLQPNTNYTYSVDETMQDNPNVPIGIDRYTWDFSQVIGATFRYASSDNSSITFRTGATVPSSATIRCFFGQANCLPAQTNTALHAFSSLQLFAGSGTPTVTLSGAATGTISPSTGISSPSICIPTTAAGTGALTFTVTQQGTSTYTWSFGTYNGNNPSNINGWNTNPAATGNLPFTRTGTSLSIANIGNQPGTVTLTVAGCGLPQTYTYHINRSHSVSSSVTLGPNCINPAGTVSASLATNASQNVLNWTANANFTFPAAVNGTTITANPGAIPNSYLLPVGFFGCASPTQSYTVNVRPTAITSSPATLCIPRNGTAFPITFTPAGTNQYSYSITGTGNTLNGPTLTSVAGSNNVVNVQRTTTALGGTLTPTFTAAAGCAFTAPPITISTAPVVPTVTPPSCVNGNVPNSNAVLTIPTHLGAGTYTVNFVSGQAVLSPSGNYTPNASNQITVPVSATVIGIGTYTVTHSIPGCGTAQTSANFTVDNQTGRPSILAAVPSPPNLLIIPTPALAYRYLNCTTGTNLATNAFNSANPINLATNPTAQWVFSVTSGTGNSLGFEGTVLSGAASGCVHRVCTTINYSNKPGRGGMGNVIDSKLNLPSALGKIYPNPNGGEFAIQIFKEIEGNEAKAFVYDSKGILVAELRLEKGENKIQQKLAFGTYTLVSSLEGQNYIDRIVVK